MSSNQLGETEKVQIPLPINDKKLEIVKILERKSINRNQNVSNLRAELSTPTAY